jgi:hypothetical protein
MMIIDDDPFSNDSNVTNVTIWHSMMMMMVMIDDDDDNDNDDDDN